MITRESLNKMGKARAEVNSAVNLNCADRKISELDFMEGFRFALDLLLPGVEAYKKLVKGQEELLLAYRTGGHPKDSTFTKINEAREFLAKLEREVGVL